MTDHKIIEQGSAQLQSAQTLGDPVTDICVFMAPSPCLSVTLNIMNVSQMDCEKIKTSASLSDQKSTLIEAQAKHQCT